MTANFPPRKPDWLRQQLSHLHQRQEMTRDTIRSLLTVKANRGLDTPPPALRALGQSKEDLEDIRQQLAVLEAGWAALHPNPASGGAKQP